MSAASGNFCDARSYLYVDYTQIDGVKNTFIALYVIVILLSTLGNAMIIWTVFRNKHMRTVTNYYIVNLATSDFCVAMLVMPLKLLEYVAPCHWLVFSNDGLCAFLYFTLPVFVFTSVLTLVALSIERFYAVVYPINSRAIHSKSRTRRIIITTWVVAMIFAIPYLFCKTYAFNIHSGYGTVSRQICNDRFDYIDEAMYGSNMKHSGRFRKGFFLFLFVAMYVIPSCIILCTCIRMTVCLLMPIDKNRVLGQKRNEENKRKVARMIIIVATVFIVSWSPFYMVSLISQVQQKSFLRSSNFLFTMLSTHLVGFVNSGINPFLYICLSDKFRSSFRKILRHLLSMLCVILCCGKRKTTVEIRCRPISSTYSNQQRNRFIGEQENMATEQNPKVMRHTWRCNALRNPYFFKLRMDKGLKRGNAIPFDALTNRVRTSTIETAIDESQRLVTAVLEASSPGLHASKDSFMNAAPHREDSLCEIRSTAARMNSTEEWSDSQQVLLGNRYYSANGNTDKSPTNDEHASTQHVINIKENNQFLLETKRHNAGQVADISFHRPNSSSDSFELHVLEIDKALNTKIPWRQSYPGVPLNPDNISSSESLELNVRNSAGARVTGRIGSQQCERNNNPPRASKCHSVLEGYPCLRSDIV